MHKSSAFKCILVLFHHPTQFFTHPKFTIGKYCIYRVIIHYALLHLWQHCTTQLHVWPCGKKRVNARWCEAGHGGSWAGISQEFGASWGAALAASPTWIVPGICFALHFEGFLVVQSMQETDVLCPTMEASQTFCAFGARYLFAGLGWDNHSSSSWPPCARTSCSTPIICNMTCTATSRDSSTSKSTPCST